jgi:hypothetical protein
MPLLKLLMVPQLAIAYIILALIMALLGRNKAIGFWGFFLLSLILTPVVIGVFMIINRDRRPSRAGR